MFNKLSDVFEAIMDCDYLILRNYEDFENMNFLQSHPDIDLLCRRREPVIQALSLKSRRKKEDGIHYYVVVDGVKVAVDLRCVGDGYLDAAWESVMLQQRVKKNNFYVMDAENYFYSLLYHVTVQKKQVAEDYKVRLRNMSEQAGIPFRLEKKEQILDSFLDKHGYRYVYPEYPGTIFQVSNVRKDLIEKNPGKQIQRTVYQMTRGIWNVFKK